MANTNTIELIRTAINNSRSNKAVEEATLVAAYAQHGKESQHGSWLEMPPEDDNRDAVEATLFSLKWEQTGKFPGGIIATAPIPAGIWGWAAALPADQFDPDAKVQIDLSIPGHPSAILLEKRDPEVAATVTMIVELEAGDDPDIQKVADGFRGPVVSTWFPGPSTPRSTPDGVLKDGDIVTVREAAAHGFKTIKF